MHLTKITSRFRRLGLATAFALIAAGARAEIAVVAGDNKLDLVNGTQRPSKTPRPDTLSIIDLSVSPPRLVAEIEGVPCSLVGPPTGVAITPDERLVLVTAPNKIDPANPARQTPDNKLTVVDLTTTPPQVIATLETGAGPSGVSINRAGTLALVANRSEGSVSVFTIEGKTLTAVGKLQVGAAAANVGQAIFTPDGRRALVSRDGDHMVTLLNVDGTKVTLANRNIRGGLKPYCADVSRDGSVAVVANVGFLNGDIDTIGVIDLRAEPPRAVDVIAVGEIPEGIRLSPDGSLCAVALQNGSNKPADSPFYRPTGKLVLFRVAGTKLTRVAEIAVGKGPQMAAFSADNRTIMVADAIDRDVAVLRWDGAKLTDTTQRIKVKGAPATIATADR